MGGQVDVTQSFMALFNAINKNVFNSQIPDVSVVVSMSTKPYVHFVPESFHLACSTGLLLMSDVELLNAFLREMIHIYDYVILKVSDRSRGGTYYNKRFAHTARIFNIPVERNDRYGFQITSELSASEIIGNRRLLHCLASMRSMIFPEEISSQLSSTDNKHQTTPYPNARRYVCPKCGTIVRATKKVNILCGDCNIAMVESTKTKAEIRAQAECDTSDVVIDFVQLYQDLTGEIFQGVEV